MIVVILATGLSAIGGVGSISAGSGGCDGRMLTWTVTERRVGLRKRAGRRRRGTMVIVKSTEAIRPDLL